MNIKATAIEKNRYQAWYLFPISRQRITELEKEKRELEEQLIIFGIMPF
jgi:hypothetical protein